MKLYKYCQLAGRQKMFGKGLKIRIDYGNGLEDLEDEEDNIIHTESIIYASNYLIKCGWEFTQAYAVSMYHGEDIQYWVFRKEVSAEELDETLVIYDN